MSRFRLTGWHFVSILCGKSLAVVVTSIPSYHMLVLRAWSTEVFFMECFRHLEWICEHLIKVSSTNVIDSSKWKHLKAVSCCVLAFRSKSKHATLSNISICVPVGLFCKVEFWVNYLASLRRTVGRILDDNFLSEFLAGSEERATFRDSYWSRDASNWVRSLDVPGKQMLQLAISEFRSASISRRVYVRSMLLI